MRDRKPKQEKKYEELLLEVRRVTRVTTGGRRLSFRATIIVGNKKGKIGLGIAKSGDVAGAVSKATHDAYKNMYFVPIIGSNTVPYTVTHKYKSAIVKLIPAGAGTGLKAGSAVRAVLDLAGYNNILSKIIGTNNKLNNALATIYALSQFKAERTAQEDDDVETAVEEKQAKIEKFVKSEKPTRTLKAPIKKSAPKVESSTEENVDSKEKKPAVKKETIKKVVVTEVKKSAPKAAKTTEEKAAPKAVKKAPKKSE